MWEHTVAIQIQYQFKKNEHHFKSHKERKKYQELWYRNSRKLHTNHTHLHIQQIDDNFPCNSGKQEIFN